MIYKFSNTEIVVSTANTVYDNPIIRLVNPTAAVVNATVSVNSSANLYSFTILGNSEIIIEKGPTNRVQGTGLFASPVAYRH